MLEVILTVPELFGLSHGRMRNIIIKVKTATYCNNTGWMPNVDSPKQGGGTKLCLLKLNGV